MQGLNSKPKPERNLVCFSSDCCIRGTAFHVSHWRGFTALLRQPGKVDDFFKTKCKIYVLFLTLNKRKTLAVTGKRDYSKSLLGENGGSWRTAPHPRASLYLTARFFVWICGDLSSCESTSPHVSSTVHPVGGRGELLLFRCRRSVLFWQLHNGYVSAEPAGGAAARWSGIQRPGHQGLRWAIEGDIVKERGRGGWKRWEMT